MSKPKRYKPHGAEFNREAIRCPGGRVILAALVPLVAGLVERGYHQA